ncbi:hypothetical protein AB0H87_41465, partial [Asanoa sp. NPDC050611]
MTSEGPQHPGYEPDEAAPDAGGPRYPENDPRRRAAGESWAPPGYDPPQRTDQWNPPGAQPAWGAGAPQGRPGEPYADQGGVNGRRPDAPPAPYTPAPAPIPQASEPTPLPPQQTRVPGASFGAFPPGEPSDNGGFGAIDYHGKAEYPASVPQPRTASDSSHTGRVQIPQPTDPGGNQPSSGGPSYGAPNGFPGPSGWAPTSDGGPGAGQQPSRPGDSGGFSGFGSPVPPQGTTPTSGGPPGGGAPTGSASVGSASVGSARVGGAASVPMGAVRVDPGQFGAPEQQSGPVSRFGPDAEERSGGHPAVPSQGGPGQTSGPPSGPPSAGRAVSASASVPTASRVQPASDEQLPPPATAPPQPRVYGRAVSAPSDSPAQSESSGFGGPPGEPLRGPSGFAPSGDQGADQLDVARAEALDPAHAGREQLLLR